MSMRTCLAIVLCLAGADNTRADDGKSSLEPPVAFRPIDFHGAIGSFKISMQAQPLELRAEDSLTLTVRIRGSGNLSDLERPNLRKNPAFIKSFDVVDLGDRYRADQGTREFDYRLRPRNEGVREIPRLGLVYFKPGIVPAEKGYQTTYAPPLSIRVLPRPEVTIHQVQGDAEVAVPESVREFVSAERVPPQQGTLTLTRRQLMAPLLLAPPLVCLFWCIAGGQRQRVERRLKLSRHGRKTLRALDQSTGWNEFGSVLCDYLGPFVGPLPNEVSPTEVIKRMLAHGCSLDLAEETAGLFELRNAARFAPDRETFPLSAKTNAARLIIKLEEQPWQ
jgi:hypothetical protein